VDSGKLKSNSMAAWLASRGTAQQFTASHVSAHNGQVERLHRTLANKARAMRLQATLPPNRWDELMITARYLSVRTPSKSVGGRTPFEQYYNRRPSLSHLREIGSRTFVLIQNKHNPKIYGRSVECVLVGYSPDSKAYRCYHRETHRVLTSYNVRFIESKDVNPRPYHPGLTIDTGGADSAEPHDPIIPPIVHQPHTPTPLPAPIRRSGRAIIPTERLAASTGTDRLSSLDRAIQEVKDSTNRVRHTRSIPKHQPFPPVLDHPDDLLAATELDLADVNHPDDPLSLKEAMASPEADQWRAALDDEFTSLKELGVYDRMPRSSVPSGRKIMRGKPVFHQKTEEFGRVVRYKARYVCRGFTAVYGEDYTKTTSPTARMESFRVLLHLGAALGMDIQQIDVKQCFSTASSLTRRHATWNNRRGGRKRAKRIGCGN